MGGCFFNSKVMEKDMKQAAYSELAKIESHTTLNKGTSDEIEVFEPDDMVKMFRKGVDWVLEMLWQDASEIPDNCSCILIRDFLGKIRRCEKRGDYVEDLDDHLPLVNDEICEFISIESLGKTLADGLYDKAKRFTKGG